MKQGAICAALQVRGTDRSLRWVWRQRPPVAGIRELNGAGRCYTTRSHNTHRTEQRALLYRWHPWVGRQVYVHEAIERTDRTSFRCSLTGAAAARCLEVPAWMFDRAASHCWELKPNPIASIGALAALSALLNEAAEACSRPSRSQDSGATSNSLTAIPGDAHAAPNDTSATRPIRSASRRRADADAALEELARRDASDAYRADSPPDPRPRRRRGQSAEGGGT